MNETKDGEFLILSAENAPSRTVAERMAVIDHLYVPPSEIKGQVMAEYIWIDAEGELRSKTRTLKLKKVSKVEQIPLWNFDGSSTKQADGSDSEVDLLPVKFVRDPFRRGNNILVLCECDKNGAAPGNHRREAIKKFELYKAHKPWYGLEQEYTILQPDNKTPVGWPKKGLPPPQGPYYCSAGAERAFGREIAETHYRLCLYAGLHISGINAEVMPGQWEFQVGICESIDASDSLWLARYILHRIGEMFGVIISFYPKLIKGDWNGSGLHTNYSTEATRGVGGMKVILDMMRKLKNKHTEHIAVYGLGNDERLTGQHETSPITSFSYGVGDRGASIRIPTQVHRDGKGYFEDRRPASSADPYLVTSKLLETTVTECVENQRIEVEPPQLECESEKIPIVDEDTKLEV